MAAHRWKKLTMRIEKLFQIVFLLHFTFVNSRKNCVRIFLKTTVNGRRLVINGAGEFIESKKLKKIFVPNNISDQFHLMVQHGLIDFIFPTTSIELLT